MSDLVERLRLLKAEYDKGNWRRYDEVRTAVEEAADEIERLQAQLERCQELADEAWQELLYWVPDETLCKDEHREALDATVETMRQIQQALKGTGYYCVSMEDFEPNESESINPVEGRVFFDSGGCDHEWINPRDKAVKSGEWCRKCNAIRAPVEECPHPIGHYNAVGDEVCDKCGEVVTRAKNSRCQHGFHAWIGPPKGTRTCTNCGLQLQPG